MGAAIAPSALWQRLREQDMRTVAVMGMAKNTGKTVALNHLLQAAHRSGTTIGLTSIGLDGEAHDQVFAFPKPPVRVWPGCVVATARDTLKRARVRLKMLGGTGITSPMGEIELVRVQDAGEMEVGGASRGAEQRQLIALLRDCGADTVFLDGALGRAQHASPAIAEGVVLATGAALGGGMQDVIRKTQERLALLGLPGIASATLHDAALRDAVTAVCEGGGVGVWSAHGDCLLRDATLPTLNAAEVLLAQAARAPVATVAVAGAVGRRLWGAFEQLARQAPAGLTIVVADGTRLFIDARDLAALGALGARVLAARAIRLAGITLNPFTPFGAPFAAPDFLATARAAFADDYVVADVELDAAAFTTGS